MSASRRFARRDMDDQSLNLWRQIEDCRRRNRKRPFDRRATVAPAPERER